MFKTKSNKTVLILNFYLIINLSYNKCFNTSKWENNNFDNYNEWFSTSEIIAFENKTAYLPCLIQLINSEKNYQDQLTLILWFHSWNTSGPPIYSVDFRSSLNFIKNNKIIHFATNGLFLNRINLKLDYFSKTCWPFNENRLDFLNSKQTLISEISNNYNNKMPKCAYLEIHQIKQTDAGEFSCRVDFRRSRTINTQILLKVLKQPESFELKMYNRFLVNNSIIGLLNEGSSLTIFCTLRMIDKENLFLNWKCDNLSSFYSNSIKKHNENSSFIIENKLFIKNLTRDFDKKTCKCILSSKYGQKLLHLQITIKMYLSPLSVNIIKPVTSNFPRVLNLKDGQINDIECLALNSKPIAHCTWSLSNGYIFKPKDISESNFNNFSIDTDDKESSSLSVLHFLSKYEMNKQILICTCFNPFLPLIQLKDQVYININSKPVLHLLHNSSLYKTNENSLQKYQIKLGESIKLICNFSKPCKPKWFINKIELKKFKELNQNVKIITEYTDHRQLVIQNFSEEAIGQYFCMANYDNIEVESNSILINVQYTPYCRSSQKILYTIFKGENENINCDVYTDPFDTKLKFFWTLNNQSLPSNLFNTQFLTYNELNNSWRPLFNNFEKFLVRNTIKFKSLTYRSNKGTLACWAINSFGQQVEPCLFNILIISSPEKPENCTLKLNDINESIFERQFEINCKPGNDNGLSQLMHLNVYRIAGGLSKPNKTNDTSILINHESSSLTLRPKNMISYNHVIQYFNYSPIPTSPTFSSPISTSKDLELIVKQTVIIKKINYNKYIKFNINLTTIYQYNFIIFSSNIKGQSENVVLKWDSSLNNSGTIRLNLFIFFGNFFLGICIAIFIIYSLFTLALWFPFCLQLQLKIIDSKYFNKSF